MSFKITKQNKWYLEEKCRHGKDCHGWKSGACPYNHQGLRGYIQTKGKIPQGFCKYENPLEGKRCWRLRCFCDHLKGRAGFIERKQQRFKIGPKHAGTGDGTGDSVGDGVDADTSDGDGDDDDTSADADADADTGVDVDAIEAPRTPDRPTRPVSPRAPSRLVRFASPIVTAVVGLPVRVLAPPLPED